MFFLSKLLSAATQPMFWLALWWRLALGQRRRFAVAMLWTGDNVRHGLNGNLGFTLRPAVPVAPTFSPMFI